MTDEIIKEETPEEKKLREGRELVQREVIRCFAEVLGRDPSTIDPNDRLEVDLRINTTQVMRFTMLLEDAIGIKFNISDIRRHRTVSKVIKMVQKYYEA